METRRTERSVPTKVPVLKITINKKYNNRSVPYPTGLREPVNPSKPVVSRSSSNAKPGLAETASKPAEPKKSDQPESEGKSVVKSSSARPREDAERSKRSWKCKGDLSRENVRSRTNAERLRHLNTKAQRELEILMIRLKALKERHKYEKKEIARLDKHLGLHCKDILAEPPDEIVASRVKKENGCTELPESGNEDECERMLKEVRRMKRSLEETAVMKRLNDKSEWLQTSDQLRVRTSRNGETQLWPGSIDAQRRNGTVLPGQNEENAIDIKEEVIDSEDN